MDIKLTGVKQNNLKNLTVEFPLGKLSVVTGLSGSGKSSLAFDTLYAEGQRRYVQSLSTYIRQFMDKLPRPEVDKVENIPPSIALEQRNHIVNSRSTVGTQTELADYFRIVYARSGQTHCPICSTQDHPVLATSLTTDRIAETFFKRMEGKKSAVAVFMDLPRLQAMKKTLGPWIQSTGYNRVLFHTPAEKSQKLDKIATLSSTEMVTLEDLDLSQLHKRSFFLILDRLKLKKENWKEEKSRVVDSIEQALKIGQQKLYALDLDAGSAEALQTGFGCPLCFQTFRIPIPEHFSFNHPLGACTTCSGFGFNLELDEALVVPDVNKSLRNGAIDPLSKPSMEDEFREMIRFAERNKISTAKKYGELNASEKKLLWDGSPEDDSFAGIRPTFDALAKHKYKVHVRVFIRRYQNQVLCKTCSGKRLHPESLHVKLGDTKGGFLDFSDSQNLTIQRILQWLLKIKFSTADKKKSGEALSQIEKRLSLLEEVGVGYLTLSRLAKSLSGGEFQRISLATQLGNGLCGTLYVLDEPSIGLHPRDTERLIAILHRLRNQGNTVVVVEHDLEVMRAADHLVELGPHAGARGGELVGIGNAGSLMRNPHSLTGGYLSGRLKFEKEFKDRGEAKNWLKLTGCREHNLKDLTVEFPLERLTVVTGVSGSGKSTLVDKTLYRALGKIFPIEVDGPPGKFDKLYGAQNIGGVSLLDQSPIGRSSRSNPATYMKAWDDIRLLYANQTLSLKRGYSPQYFSFNVDGGRCPNCRGEGEIEVDMHFMAALKVPCEVCEGRRFKKNILEVEFRGKNIAQLMKTTIDEAYEIFRDLPVSKKFSILRDVGLGYLQVGQSATTLSGGESQRLKIAHALNLEDLNRHLFVFDEPTTGLHIEDIKKLMRVLHELVESKHTVILIEHNIDVIAQADWIIDVGPGGGEQGGEVVVYGSPERISRNEESETGRSLARHRLWNETHSGVAAP